MPDWFADVLEFHRRCAPDKIGTTPAVPLVNLVALRKSLVEEEIAELFDAMVAGDVVGIADAVADSIYVLLGLCITYGINANPIFDAVHAANLKKEGGPNRVDGKVLKGPDWIPPDIKGILARQGPLS